MVLAPARLGDPDPDPAPDRARGAAGRVHRDHDDPAGVARRFRSPGAAGKAPGTAGKAPGTAGPPACGARPDRQAADSGIATAQTDRTLVNSRSPSTDSSRP